MRLPPPLQLQTNCATSYNSKLKDFQLIPFQRRITSRASKPLRRTMEHLSTLVTDLRPRWPDVGQQAWNDSLVRGKLKAPSISQFLITASPPATNGNTASAMMAVHKLRKNSLGVKCEGCYLDNELLAKKVPEKNIDWSPRCHRHHRKTDLPSAQEV